MGFKEKSLVFAEFFPVATQTTEMPSALILLMGTGLGYPSWFTYVSTTISLFCNITEAFSFNVSIEYVFIDLWEQIYDRKIESYCIKTTLLFYIK